jgi:hypothetical protein
MQIYEITYQPLDEAILKGVANNAPAAAPAAKPTTMQNAGNALKLAPLNTAEYFANKMLNAAGVPQDQQGTYSKYGHMAAGQRQGTTSMEKQQQYIANELSKEWASSRTLNGIRSDALDPEEIKKAALAYNSGTGLEIDLDNVIDRVKTLAPQYVKDKEAQQKERLAMKARQQVEIKNLMSELEKEYTVAMDPSSPDITKQQAENKKNQIVANLKNLGYTVDAKYMADTTAAAQNAVVQTGGAQMMSAPAATQTAPNPFGQMTKTLSNTPSAAKAPPTPAKPVSTASPPGYNYSSMMKMPGMNTPPVKKPVPTPAVAESLTWSKDFDPSTTLYDRMKRENK